MNWISQGHFTKSWDQAAGLNLCNRIVISKASYQALQSCDWIMGLMNKSESGSWQLVSDDYWEQEMR